MQKPKLMQHVAAPMVVIVSREKGGFPPTWRPGPRRVWMWLFGLIPLGSQTINIEFPESKDGSYRLRDNGSGLLARKWDHHLSLEPHGDGSRYRDRIHLAAGVFTPFVWLFALALFHWRQFRWRALVRQWRQANAGPLARAGA